MFLIFLLEAFWKLFYHMFPKVLEPLMKETVSERPQEKIKNIIGMCLCFLLHECKKVLVGLVLLYLIDPQWHLPLLLCFIFVT